MLTLYTNAQILYINSTNLLTHAPSKGKGKRKGKGKGKGIGL